MNDFSNLESPLLVAGSVFGIRRYNFSQEAFPLFQGNYGKVWESAYMEASCSRVEKDCYNWECNARVPGHVGEIPSEECTCGIYAYWSADLIPDESSISIVFNNTKPRVGFAAVVEGYGRVLLGTMGFRAQKVRMSGLFYMPDPEESLSSKAVQARRRLVGAIGEYYEIPTYSSLEELLEAHPLTTEYLSSVSV